MNQDSSLMPAEWTKHHSVWLAWPSASDLWLENLLPAQEEFTAFCHAIQDLDPKTKLPRGESINLLVSDEKAKTQAQKALKGLSVTYHLIPYGDIWLRDTAPLFVKSSANKLKSLCFQFNGWGEKYVLEFDNAVASRISDFMTREFLTPNEIQDWVLEGGSIEIDGEGTCLTSKQCLLNKNRNPGLSQKEIENRLKSSLGIRKVLWLGDGLINDHTDGHIDTIARFSSPGTVLCMKALSEKDPNAAIMHKIESDLRLMTDAQDRPLKVGLIPSPGAIYNQDEDLLPASYLNFYIANSTVIVPTYNSVFDKEAVESIAQYFPDRKTIGLSAKAILSGGGAFHCISQQIPIF